MSNYLKLVNIIFVLLLATCNFSEKKKIIENIQFEGPNLEVENILTTFSDSARIKFILKANRYHVYNDKNEIYPDGLKMDIFSNYQKKVIAKFSANYVKRNFDDDFYHAEGNVILYNLENENELRTEELFWFPNDEKFSTNKFVTIKSDNEIHSGEGMVSNHDFTSYEILNPSGVIDIDEN
tara:strand:+ start:4004 stop:4546 length:543 start_codon:yes stop_codon:yes gene_type:complete